MASKILTRDQAQARKDQAIRFAENGLGDSDLADNIESESLDDWVERKTITLIDNQGQRSLKMANGNGCNGQTKADLLDQIADLQDENDALQSQLDAISDILGGPEDEEDDQDDDGDDDDGN